MSALSLPRLRFRLADPRREVPALSCIAVSGFAAGLLSFQAPASRICSSSTVDLASVDPAVLAAALSAAASKEAAQ